MSDRDMRRRVCSIIQSAPVNPLAISLIFSHKFSWTLLCFTIYVEQEPTLSDPDSDEEADLVLSLETETGLLTNQHTKGKRKLNWGNEIIDAASD